jgi:hypothetical protein
MSAPLNEAIEIHQALYGYSDGHRLLEASRSWPREIERTLLVLSDMSGPRMLPGFESYLTGYSLPDVGVYAFAKTWYAAEMDRPGCVWTHTLFIDNSDLARFRSLQVLLQLFCRPQKERPWSTYKAPLTLPSLSLGEIDFQEFSHPPISSDSYTSTSSLDEVGIRADRSYRIARKILTALYGHPGTPTFVSAESSEQYVDTAVAIWSQQWPRLRRAFHFCTGALSNRSINSKVFDLQFIPPDLARVIHREVPRAQFLGLQAETNQSDFPTWAKFAALNLSVQSQKRFPWEGQGSQERLETLPGGQNTFHQFLWTFGADITEGRAAFPGLVEVFLAVHETLQPSSLSVVTDLVSRYFPKAEDAAQLKKVIFGQRTHNDSRFLSGVTEADLLRELITTRHYAVFDRETLNLHDRAKVLWKRQREVAKSLILELDHTHLNPLGDGFLSGIAASITEADVSEFLERNLDVLLTLIRYNVSLAASPELWQGSPTNQHKLLETIATCQGIPFATLKAIVAAILSAGGDSTAENVVKQLGQQAIGAVLEWFDRSPLKTVEELKLGWRRILAAHSGALLGWLSETSNPREATVAFIANLLDPYSPEVQRFGAQVWLQFLPLSLEKLDRQTFSKTMSFLLALAFNNPGPGTEELVAQTFEPVHDAAENDELDSASWTLLSDQAPSLSLWRDWDQCERLRHALVERFIRYNWSIAQFLRCAKRKQTFQQIVEICRMTSSGKAFLRKVIEAVNEQKVLVTDTQQEVLFDNEQNATRRKTIYG